MRILSSICLAAALVLGASAIIPAETHAHGVGAPAPEAGLWLLAVASIPVFAFDCVLVGEGIDKAVHDGRGLYTFGATFELIWGVLHVVGALQLAVIGVTAADALALLVPSAALGAFGSYFIAHGIWSLLNPRAAPPPVSVALEPRIADHRIDGAVITIGGRL